MIATLVETSAGSTLAFDTEAIAKGDSDECGDADVVCVGNGPAQHTTIWSDVPLLAGDRIVDFIDLGEDSETGKRLYLAWVEW